jgi:hypothetical protein
MSTLSPKAQPISIEMRTDDASNPVSLHGGSQVLLPNAGGPAEETKVDLEKHVAILIKDKRWIDPQSRAVKDEIREEFSVPRWVVVLVLLVSGAMISPWPSIGTLVGWVKKLWQIVM